MPAWMASERAGNCVLLPGEGDRAGIRPVGAENGAGRLRPARAEQPGETDDLACADLEADVADLAPAGEMLEPSERARAIAVGMGSQSCGSRQDLRRVRARAWTATRSSLAMSAHRGDLRRCGRRA